MEVDQPDHEPVRGFERYIMSLIILTLIKWNLTGTLFLLFVTLVVNLMLIIFLTSQNQAHKNSTSFNDVEKTQIST